MLGFTNKAVYSLSELEIISFKSIIRIKKEKKYIYKKEKKEKKYIYDSQRGKTRLRRLINMNNTRLNSFYTLTFRDEIKDLKQANYLFNQFIKRLTYYYPNLIYIAVPEYQKRGVVHYHLLCSLTKIEISSDHLAMIWKHGFIKAKTIYKSKALSYYFMKYFSKDELLQNFYNKKRFFYSKNILKPIILYGQEINLYMHFLANRLSIWYRKTILNNFVGLIRIAHYHIT